MRLNIWLNEQNFEREHTLVGDKFAGGRNTQNTVFCLFEPYSEGMSADAFPVENSIYYGTRAGARYPVCCTPDTGNSEAAKQERIKFIKARRLEDLGETEVPAPILERILWEFENSRDGVGLAKIMNDLAAMHPVKASASDALPFLPLLPDLTQAINMGATDSRAVLAIVHPAEGSSPMEANLRQLLFEEGIAGRIHAVSMTAAEWAAAKASGKVKGGDLDAGLMFVRPDTFGRDAELQTEVPAQASLDVTRVALQDSLKVFRETWRKLDRESHLNKGIAEGITWREWHPDAKRIIDLPVGKWKGDDADAAKDDGKGESSDG